MKSYELHFPLLFTLIVHISSSFHSQALSIMKFNGLNFSEWSEQVQFHLRVMDLDLTLMTDKSIAIDDVWKRSNRLSLMLMRMTIAENIRLTIPKIDSAKKFIMFIEDHFQFDFADKSVVGTLMNMLTTMKFDGSRTMHEHVTEMTIIATRLGSMGLKVSDNFLVQFIINSLPPTYSPFQINYNTIKDK
ncbi:hypothetical protein Pfo_005460 [Paulownia fortunei]|nr:hypothetical protein Pfo_005460 [Paulownia fortunei]